jgi:hypothetical protein
MQMTISWICLRLFDVHIGAAMQQSHFYFSMRVFHACKVFDEMPIWFILLSNNNYVILGLFNKTSMSDLSPLI